jgi:hypothetical protein
MRFASKADSPGKADSILRINWQIGFMGWIGFIAAALFAQPAPPSMPAWVAAYPGSTPNVLNRPALAEISYVANASQDQVIEFLRNQFTSAGLPFDPSDNGVGVSVRTSAPECDLLVRVAERLRGTSVTVSCTPVFRGTRAGSAGSVGVVRGPSSGAVYPPRQGVTTPPLPAGASARAREMDARSRQAVADMEARQRERESRMSRFDNPVTPAQREPFYHDDAAPLTWPAWLVQFGGNVAAVPKPGVAENKLNYLRSAYQTHAPMSELHGFYKDLLVANGFRVGQSRLSTGETLEHVLQNADGYVLGSHSEGGSVNSPATEIRVDFNRRVLNGPITVSLRVTAKGSFGGH